MIHTVKGFGIVNKAEIDVFLEFSCFFDDPATPVYLPGNFHGQRSLTGYNPWGHKESDTAEKLSTKLNNPLYKYISCFVYPFIL